MTSIFDKPYTNHYTSDDDTKIEDQYFDIEPLGEGGIPSYTGPNHTLFMENVKG